MNGINLKQVAVTLAEFNQTDPAVEAEEIEQAANDAGLEVPKNGKPKDVEEWRGFLADVLGDQIRLCMDLLEGCGYGINR